MDSRSPATPTARDLDRVTTSLRLAVEAAQVGFVEFDVLTGRFDASDELYTIRGFDPVAGRARTTEEKWRDIHPDDLPRVRREVGDLIAGTRDVLDVEFRLCTAGGDWLWIHQRGRVVERDADGRVVRIAAACMDVDRRKRAERGLAASESRYRTVVAMTPGFLHETAYDAAGRCVLRWVSEGFVRVLGWSMEEVNARGGWDALTHPADLPAAHARRDRVFRDRQSCAAEVRLLTRSGEVRWFSVASFPLQDPETGRVDCMMGSLYDVTALKAKDAALRDSEARFRVATDAARAIVYELDLPRRPGAELRAVGVEHVLGLPGADVATLESWLARVHPDDRPALARAADAPLATGGASSNRYRMRHASGRWIELLDRSRTVVDANGAPVRIVGCSVDVTRERRVERMLSEAEAIAHIGSWEFDVASGRLEWSAETFRIHELDPDGPQPDADAAIAYYAPRSAPRIRAAFEDCVAHGTPFDLDLEIVTARGQRRWVQASGRGDPSGGPPVRIHGTCRDITAQREAELARRGLEAEVLEISNREQRRIGSDLHDGLGQDLTGIALLLRGVTGRAAAAAPGIGRELEDILKLVNDAIENTRALARGLSPVALEGGDLAQALRALAARARMLYGLDVRFRSRIEMPLALDAAATGHLYRIAQEALTNAARHARAGRVSVQLSARGQRVTLAVADDGVGLRAGATHGMGLKIMRYRAHILGGELRIEAGEGGGTRVTCWVRQGATAARAAGGPAAA